MVDTTDLKSVAFGREGSTPFSSTMWIVYTIMFIAVVTMGALWVYGIDKNKDTKGDDFLK